MEKRYKHKNNGSLMVYFDGCMKIDNLVIEGHPNMEYWEEIVKPSFITLSDGATIIKVRRLKDNIDFCIGDKVEQPNCTSNSFTISGFTLDCNGESMLALGGNGGVSIDKIEHYVKKAIAITEDGVELFEDDPYYYLHLHSFHIDNARAHKPFFDVNTTGKYFSTKIAADTYKLFNKSCLSLNDVFKVYPQFKKMGDSILTKHAEELINLVKK